MAEGQRLALPRILCLLSAGVAVSNAGAPHSSVMLQELSHMDRITQLQDEIQQVSFCFVTDIVERNSLQHATSCYSFLL